MQHDILEKRRSLTLLLLGLFLISAVFFPMKGVMAVTGPEDSYEENDTITAAADITEGVYNLSLYDEDYFKINVTLNVIITINLTYDSAAQNMTIILYDPLQQLVSQSSNYNGFEEIYYNVTTAPGTYYIEVTTYDTVYANETYLLGIDLTYPDDGFEDNDNPTSAAYLTSGNYTDLYQVDDDYYEVTLNASDKVEVRLEYNYLIENLTVSIEDFYSYEIYATGTFNTTLNALVVEYQSTLLYPEDFLIHVSGNNTGTLYNMTIIITDLKVEDTYEENDNATSAPEIYPDYYSSLTLTDPDYYAIYLYPNDYLTVCVYPYIEDNSIAVDLLDSAGTYILSGSFEEEEGVTIFLEYTASTEGYYFILIYSMETYYGNGYDMDIYVQAPPPPDDPYEENDFPDEATGLSPGTYNNLILADPDWFIIDYIDAYDACFFRVEINLRDITSDYVSLSIYDGYLNLLQVGINDSTYHIYAEIYGYSGKIYISVDYSSYYYEQTSPDAPTAAATGDLPPMIGSYDLILDTICDQGCSDDNFEENDDPFSAYPISPGHIDGLILCDDDFYSIALRANETVKIEVSGDLQGVVILDLLRNENGDYNPISQVNLTTSTTNIILTWTADRDDKYVIAVILNNPDPEDIGLVYALDVSLNLNDDTSGGSDDTSGGASDGSSGSGDDLANPFAAIPGYPIEGFLFFTMLGLIKVLFMSKRKR